MFNRIIVIVSEWINFHFYDFEDDSALLNKLQSFITKLMNSSEGFGQNVADNVVRLVHSYEKKLLMLISKGISDYAKRFLIQQKHYSIHLISALLQNCGAAKEHKISVGKKTKFVTGFSLPDITYWFQETGLEVSALNDVISRMEKAQIGTVVSTSPKIYLLDVRFFFFFLVPHFHKSTYQ